MSEQGTGSLKKNQPAARPGRGGPRPNSGRKPGKVTETLREIARRHMIKAVTALVEVLDDKDAPAAARVSAANSILDRGYGKPSQPIDGDGNGGAIVHRIEMVAVSPK
jgi:hypothetical protein